MKLKIDETGNNTLDDLIRIEETSDDRYELIDGKLLLMGSAKGDHGIITTTIAGILRLKFKGTPCTVITESMKVKVKENIYRPDVTVICGKMDLDKDINEKPSFLVEVLSKSTAFQDRHRKLFNYMQIPDLKGYLIIEKEIPRVELYQMVDDEIKQTIYLENDTIGINDWFELKVNEIYEDIELQRNLYD